MSIDPLFVFPAQVAGLVWDSTLRNVVLGAGILGIVGGVLGSFATLRQQSLLGDTLAHAALPGVCIAFMITGTRESLPLMVGAGLSGLVGTLLFLLITHRSRIKEDAALGIVLSVGFGLGILLLTRIQHSGASGQSGLDRFLFGQAASLVTSDVVTMAVLGVIAMAAVILWFKEFKLISFDPDFAMSIGLPTPLLTVMLTALTIVAVVIGLQAVGVILIVAILIAPAVAARQWTDRLSTMVVLAGAFGAVAGISGALLSSQLARLPTGPTVVLAATLITGISLLFAPRRGVVWDKLARRQRQAGMRRAAALRELASLSAGQPGVALTPAMLAPGTGARSGVTRGDLTRLARQGLLEAVPGRAAAWRMTGAGEAAATRAARQERLWKRFMARQMEIGVENVHLDASEIERVLPPEVLLQIEAELQAEDALPDRTAPAGRAPLDHGLAGLSGAERVS